LEGDQLVWVLLAYRHPTIFSDGTDILLRDFTESPLSCPVFTRTAHRGSGCTWQTDPYRPVCAPRGAPCTPVVSQRSVSPSSPSSPRSSRLRPRWRPRIPATS